MERNVLKPTQKFTSKLPARTGSKIPGPTPNKGTTLPNKGILRQGQKREAEATKENANVAITEPPTKKVSLENNI